MPNYVLYAFTFHNFRWNEIDFDVPWFLKFQNKVWKSEFIDTNRAAETSIEKLLSSWKKENKIEMNIKGNVTPLLGDFGA